MKVVYSLHDVQLISSKHDYSVMLSSFDVAIENMSLLRKDPLFPQNDKIFSERFENVVQQLLKARLDLRPLYKGGRLTDPEF